MTTPRRRRLAVSAATLTFAALAVTSCGAVGQAMDCGTAATEASEIATEWSTAVTKNVTDTAALQEASKSAATKMKDLAGKYDGDLASALNDLADGFAGMENGDQSGVAALAGKMNDYTTKVQSACS
ncbi:hypothetical protein SAMN05421874_102296 [Nonomuraea maritima]|uniref:Small secreted protein n=1 Tax=Nonomuraea maritima TaxID=683260 RepID=A0A1G8UW67_9ACTN|nr:hypothetical protein [Nonomuraea maritima]SDJ58051.1 hypothetical protein SAMN05421874_102296 [Nonomuraea maritima]